MQEPNAHLALTLRELRQQRGWSLDRTASETGVSKAMLGQIERQESSPTLATLWKLASGFNTSLSALLEAPPNTPCSTPCTTLIRNAAALRAQPITDAMLVAPLFPFDPAFGFELFELTLLPGYERLSEPHAPGVIEHVMVIEGTMELLLDGKWQSLHNGDAARFAADKAHGYRNLGSHLARFHNLIHYPGGR